MILRHTRPSGLSRRGIIAGLGLGVFAPGQAYATIKRVLRGRAGGGGGGSYPASIASPSVGTPLTGVYDLMQAGATGPRSAFAHSWSGRALAAAGGPTGDAYLDGLGFIVNNNHNALYLDVGVGTKTISNYDFSTCPVRICFNGSSGILNLVDCKFADGASWIYPVGINEGAPWDASTMQVNASYCEFDGTTFYQGSGVQINDHCRFKNQVQTLGDSSYNNTHLCQIYYNHCYITGGGVYGPQNPTTLEWAHIELTQMINSHPESGIFCNDTFINFVDGQATTLSQAGWTGVFSGGPNELMTNCIVAGLPAMEANPSAPGKTNCILAYGNGVAAVLTNCAVDPGRYGYTFNQTGEGAIPYEGRDGGGNRTFTTNAPLTAADMG